jgi:hypothetical protein
VLSITGAVEELLHFRPRKATESLLDFRKAKADRLELELAAPGREFALIYDAHKQFSWRVAHPLLDSGLVGDIGLVLDITGAFFLAQSFVLKKKEEIARETASYFDSNPFLLRNACYSSVEARVGVFFLVLGFVGQYVADTQAFPPGPGSYWWATMLAEAVLLGVVWLLTKARSRAISRRLVSVGAYAGMSQLVEYQREGRPQPLNPDHWAAALDCDRQPGEGDYDFFLRLKRLSGYWSARYMVLMRRRAPEI